MLICDWFFFSLRHFQHVRKQQPETAEKFRKSLLDHLQQLNDVVNKSMSLLSHLPDVAEKLGLNTIFKPEPVSIYFLVITIFGVQCCLRAITLVRAKIQGCCVEYG